MKEEQRNIHVALGQLDSWKDKVIAWADSIMVFLFGAEVEDAALINPIQSWLDESPV